jgi:hypothetical protein
MRIFTAFCAAAALAFALHAGPAAAQAIKQIQLTDRHIEGFIAAQKDMAAVFERMQGGAGKPDPKILAELESLAKKHGFTSFSEFDAAGANISMIMSGLDPKSKAFSEPSVVIRKEIEEVKADKAIPAAEKAQMLKELDDALKTAQPVQFPANIELVKKYFDKLVAVLQESRG